MRPQHLCSLNAPMHVRHVWPPKLRLSVMRTVQIMGFVLVAAAFAACAAGHGALVQPSGIRAFQVRKQVPMQPPNLTRVLHTLRGAVLVSRVNPADKAGNQRLYRRTACEGWEGSPLEARVMCGCPTPRPSAVAAPPACHSARCARARRCTCSHPSSGSAGRCARAAWGVNPSDTLVHCGVMCMVAS